VIKDKNFYKTIFTIALPSAFQALISFLVVIADNVMTSYIGDGVSAQAAVSQVNSITAFYTASMLGLVSGSSVLIAQYWGKHDTLRIKKIFAFMMALCFGVSCLFLAAARIFGDGIIGLVITSGDAATLEYASVYFGIVCFSYIPYALSYSFVGMLRAVEIVRVTLYITLAALVTNIGLNYVLIFGKLGFPQMGVAGAAVATLVSRIVEMIIVWTYTFAIQKKFPLKLREMFTTERALIKDYFKFGFPVALGDTQWALIGMLKAAIIGGMGTVFMAANSIASSMAQLGTMFTFALAGGACVVVGKAVGAGKYDTVRQYSKTIQIMFALIGVVMALIVFFIRKPFISLYGSSSDADVFSLASTMIIILAATVPLTSYHASCFVGINRGAGDSRFVMKVDLICGWLIVLPTTYLAAFVFNAPLPVVFLCTRIDQCFKWIIAFIRLRGNKWIKNVTHGDNADDNAKESPLKIEKNS